MPFLVRTIVNGKPNHSIEYGPRSRLSERLGTEEARIEISAKVAGGGLDALTRIYFPEAQQDGA